MYHVMIDNCSLRDLIDNWGYSKYLPELENLISTRKITFITHQLIIGEWNRHKEAWKKQKEKKLLGHPSVTGQSKELALLPGNSLVHADHLQLQIDRIDHLLANASLILETPPLIVEEFAERFRKKLAPLHNKLNGQNDWEIIGSAGHYCQKNGIRELYFLSANDTDFGGGPGSIHPDIQQRFDKLHIRYYRDYTVFFDDMNNTGRIPVDLIGYTLVPNERFAFHNTVKKTVLDSLCFLYTELYEEIDFIPTHILGKLYPFASSEDSNAHFGNFKMHYVSENMAAFFAGITVGDTGILYRDEPALQAIKDYREKVPFVLKKLTGNLVFHIDGEKTRKQVCTHDFRYSFCECVQCSFDRLEFNKTFMALQKGQEGYKEKLRQAYMHYKLGNYVAAGTIYDALGEAALQDGKFITYFIVRYNQRNLAKFLGNFFTNRNVDANLVDRLEKLDPLEEAVKLKTHTDYNLVSYIATQEFFTDAFQEISETVGKIVAHYRSQLNGGWASNEFIWKLISSFAELEYFLNRNYIIYDGFLNFERLFELVAEGLFASHAITASQGDRFEKLDNYWVLKFLFYGKRETIVRLFNRYQLRSIKYLNNGNEKESFLAVVENLLSRNNTGPLPGMDDGNHYFRMKFDLLLENALTMGAILDMDKALVNRFGNILIAYLENRQAYGHSLEEALKYFIKRKAALFTTRLKYDFFNYGLSVDKCKYSELLFEAIAAFKDNGLRNISKKQLAFLINGITGTCAVCNGRHDASLVTVLYRKLGSENKRWVAAEIAALLEQKFDFELFYLAGIFGITDPDKRQLLKLVKEFRYNGNERTIRSVFGGAGDFQNSYLDSLINLCFKWDIDTTTEAFENIAAVHPYYRWLLDMEKFNYKGFDPEWVMKYGTFYYERRMAKSKRLKQALQAFLKDNGHPGIEKVLLKLLVVV